MAADPYLWPSLTIIDAAPAWLLRHWWLTLPVARTGEHIDVAEAVAVRTEALGLVRMDAKTGAGILVDKA